MELKKVENSLLFWFALIGAVGVAFDFTRNINEVKDLSVLGLEISKEFQQFFWIAIFVLTLLVGGFFVFRKLWSFYKSYQKAKKIDRYTAGNIYAITSLLVERCQELRSSGKLNQIIDDKIQEVEDRIEEAKAHARDNIDTVIDRDFFEDAVDALKNRNTKRNFDPILRNAYNSLIGSVELDKFIKEQYDSLLSEITDYVLKWLEDSDIKNYLKLTEDLQAQMLNLKKDIGSKIYLFFNPRVEKLIYLDYEAIIVGAAASIPAFKIFAERLTEKYSTAKVASLGVFMSDFGINEIDPVNDFGVDPSELDPTAKIDPSQIDPTGTSPADAIDPSDFTDIATDIGMEVYEEVGTHIASELFEYLGAAIPFIGLAFIAIKAIRLFGLIGKFINKPDKLRQMREKVLSQILQFLDSYFQKNKNQIKRSSLKLVSLLEDEFTSLQKAAKSKLSRGNLHTKPI